MRVTTALLAGLLMLLFSCAHHKRADIDSAERKDEISHAERVSAQFLSAGDFQRALEAYKEVYRKYGKDGQVLKGLSGVVEAIRKRADVAYKREDFATAGRLCRILLKSAPRPRGNPFFDAAAVARRLADCSDSLTRKGLEYYRTGEMKRAIAIWEKVLEFDPDNMEVKKAVETASLQMRNLR